MIKVIFIDFGGVYFTYASKALAKYEKRFGRSEEQMLKVLIEGAHWTEHATGRMDEESYWENVSKELKATPEELESLKDAWYNEPKPQAGMEELVKKLKRKCKVAALSSITAPWIVLMEKRYKLSEIFHECHYTFDHGIDKPDAAFFLSAAKKMKVKPEDCIVVDDMEHFLAAVRKTGAKTILFKNAKQLESELIKLGVEI